MLRFLIFCHEFHKWMICVQNKDFLSSEHIRVHSIHIVHFHHILHTAALFWKCNHRCSIFIFQFFYFYFQFVFAEVFAEYICQSLYCCFICLAIFTKLFCKIRINSLELNFLILLLKMRNKLRIYHMFQDYSIFSCLAEHVNILTLLYFICNIIDNCLFRFFLFFFLGFIRSFLFFCFGFFFLIFLNTVFQGKIFAIQIFEKNIVIHLLTEF